MNLKMLTKICGPSMSLMNKLNYPTKIMVLILLVIGMSASIICFLLLNLQTQADFSIKEKAGIEYINPLKTLFLDLQKFKDNDSAVTVADIKKDAEEIDKADSKSNKTFLVETRWSTLKDGLGSINRANASDLISQTSGLIDRVTNNSNLILDPDLDTYYLMDSYCLRFSNIIGKIYAIKSEGLKKIQGKSYNQIELIRLSVLADELNEIVKANTAVIYENNADTKLELDDAYNQSYNSTKKFLDLTNKLINGSKISVGAYAASANDAVSGNNNADQKYSAVLYELTGKRAQKYLSQEPVAVLITIVSLLIIGYLFAGFYLSLVSSVNEISANLFNIVEEVESSSNMLSQSSQILAEGNQEQAAAIQETASTLEESSSMVKQNTDNTKVAAALAKQARVAANRGSKEISEMVTSMDELKKSSDQIAKIIKVIDEIAFQTNILSLNAAVEAARAGDAGKGFAVVAEEVRNLAQRSAEAAKDTAAIIEGNIILSQKGLTASQLTSDALKEINEQVQKVNEIIDEVAVATAEQNQGVLQIHQAMSQMSIVTQSNADIADNNACSVGELSDQAQKMKVVVGGLISLINGIEEVEQPMLIAASRNNLLETNKFQY